MAINNIATRGFSTGSIDGSIALIVVRGFGEAVDANLDDSVQPASSVAIALGVQQSTPLGLGVRSTDRSRLGVGGATVAAMGVSCSAVSAFGLKRSTAKKRT